MTPGRRRMTAATRWRARWQRARRVQPILVLAAAVVVSSIVVLVFDTQQAQTETAVVAEQRDQTAEQAVAASDPVLDLCDDATAVGEALRSDPGDPCALAAQVVATPIPGAPGMQGPVGPDGRGITGTSITASGRLVVAYTDGTSADLGPVVGADGPEGPEGRGITASTLEGGRLVVSFSDGSRQDVGQVVGTDGADGATGPEGERGRGVASTAQVDGRLIVSYTDGTSEDVGPLPVGEQGDQGVQGVGVTDVRAEQRDTGCVLVFDLVDPVDGSTAERAVPVPDAICDGGGLIG